MHMLEVPEGIIAPTPLVPLRTSVSVPPNARHEQAASSSSTIQIVTPNALHPFSLPRFGQGSSVSSSTGVVPILVVFQTIEIATSTKKRK